MTDIPITPKQEMFCQEYIKDLNATQAAIRAGYSEKTADVQGPRLLGNVRVSVRVSELFRTRAAAVGVTAENVLRELLRLASVDIGAAYDGNGALLPLHDMPEDVRRCIAAVETDEITEKGEAGRVTVIGYTRKVKFWDKKGSLDSLGRYLKLFVDRVDVTSDGKSLSDLLAGTFPLKP